MTQAFFSRKGDCTKADNQIRYIDIVIVLKTLKSNAVDNSLPTALSVPQWVKTLAFSLEHSNGDQKLQIKSHP